MDSSIDVEEEETEVARQHWLVVAEETTPERWEKTSAMNVPEWGCIVRVEVGQRMPDGTWHFAMNTTQMDLASVVGMRCSKTLANKGNIILAWDAIPESDIPEEA